MESRIWKNAAKRAIFSVRIFFLCLAVSVAALAAFFMKLFHCRFPSLFDIDLEGLLLNRHTLLFQVG